MTNGEKYKTVKERTEAFKKLCNQHVYGDCKGCRAYGDGKGNMIDCLFTWIDLEYEEDKPLPCPFCGGKTFVETCIPKEFFVTCKDCGYTSKIYKSRSNSIAAHNRVAKAVKESEDEE